MGAKNRIGEIDCIRGIAIIFMVIFHLIVDLKDFYHYNINYLSGFWYYIGKAAAILFILVSGVSSTFSKNNLKRGTMVFLFGMLLTVITYFFNSALFIRFGILHFLGISMIAAHLIKGLNQWLLLMIGSITLIVGYFFNNIYVDIPYLFPIGLMDRHFSSMDYYPMFPWFGLFLYGIVIGKTVYSQRKSLLAYDMTDNILSYMGQHSLLIYLLHQPLILMVLYGIHYFI